MFGSLSLTAECHAGSDVRPGLAVSRRRVPSLWEKKQIVGLANYAVGNRFAFTMLSYGKYIAKY